MSDSSDIAAILKHCLTRGIPLNPLPSNKNINNYRNPNYPHAPTRTPNLSPPEFALAVKNALRYFPTELHNELAEEFATELKEYGHIYMYRLKPTEYPMRAYPVHYYPAKCQQAACIMLMIQNNLDPNVAQFPDELITYGGNGSVLSNWAQYHLLMYYLSQLTETATLSMYSGHPAGIFPSHKDAPRVVITNGMMIPNYSSIKDYDKCYALGVTQYGQMTAGSYAYIGPQGIVHGTTITILNAGRKYLNAQTAEEMRGKVYVSSGLGGMSGAQGKAGMIVGAVTVVAEIDGKALDKRLRQGWITEKITNLDELIKRMKEARNKKEVTAIGYLGNIVNLWEKLAEEKEMVVELGSDQTSLHNPFNGGYYPVQLSFEESQKLMKENPEEFKKLVNESLIRHVNAVNKLSQRGMKFWDYGNSFMLQASKAGADILADETSTGSHLNNSITSTQIRYRYPTYIQEFVGDIFSLGFGPFRWVCCSGLHEDLQTTDKIAAEVIKKLRISAQEVVDQQLRDNLLWIEKAEENKMVVGSEARILYADCQGRVQIALEFNKAIASGKIKGPIVLSRDHHDVGGTDSHARETSNIQDGSQFTADMAVQSAIGGAIRGGTWISLHNGGGCGWGEVMNGGFGLVLDGTEDAARRADSMLSFDVNNGVNRRAWSGNQNARLAIHNSMNGNPDLKVTISNIADDSIISKIMKDYQQSTTTNNNTSNGKL